MHEHARSSTIRYLGRPLKAGEEKKDCHIKAIYYEYWKSGCAVVDQWEQLITKENPAIWSLITDYTFRKVLF